MFRYLKTPRYKSMRFARRSERPALLAFLALSLDKHFHVFDPHAFSEFIAPYLFVGLPGHTVKLYAQKFFKTLVKKQKPRLGILDINAAGKILHEKRKDVLAFLKFFLKVIFGYIAVYSAIAGDISRFIVKRPGDGSKRYKTPVFMDSDAGDIDLFTASNRFFKKQADPFNVVSMGEIEKIFIADLIRPVTQNIQNLTAGINIAKAEIDSPEPVGSIFSEKSGIANGRFDEFHIFYIIFIITRIFVFHFPHYNTARASCKEAGNLFSIKLLEPHAK